MKNYKRRKKASSPMSSLFFSVAVQICYLSFNKNINSSFQILVIKEVILFGNICMINTKSKSEYLLKIKLKITNQAQIVFQNLIQRLPCSSTMCRNCCKLSDDRFTGFISVDRNFCSWHNQQFSDRSIFSVIAK